MDLKHYTLNTGHTRKSPRSEVADQVIEAMRPFCEPGQHDLGGLAPMLAGWSVKVSTADDCMMATVWSGRVPAVTYAVAVGVSLDGADRLWDAIERMYLDITEKPGLRSADFAAPTMPSETPWCAVVIMNEYAGKDWLGDFERCHAWAWIASQGDSHDGE